MPGCHGGQHHPRWKGGVLVVEEAGVPGQARGGSGGGGCGGRVAVRVEVALGDGGLDFLQRRRGGEPGVGRGPVPGEVGVVQELGRGHGVGLAGVSQGVLHRTLQLHAPVLEPVPDLVRRKKRLGYQRETPKITNSFGLISGDSPSNIFMPLRALQFFMGAGLSKCLYY